MISKLKEIFRWRELIFGLAFQELKARSRRASGGLGWLCWMFISSLTQVCLFTFIFKFIFKIGIKNYPLFLLSGIFPWVYLTNVIQDASMSIINNAGLIKKTYFTRQALPLSVVLTQSVIFLFPLAVLLIFSFINNPGPMLNYIWLPLVIMTQMILLTGLALIVSALNVHYRDVSFLINIILMVGFYATPIVYPVEMIKNLLPQGLARIYFANPMAGIITVYQSIFFYGQVPGLLSIGRILFVSMLILAIGFFIFDRYEARFEELL